MFWLKTYLINLNIFDSSSSDGKTDEEKQHEHRTNLIATRIFLVTLSLLLLILALVFRLITRTTIIIVKHPKQHQFQNLSSRDAYCPCSQIALPHEDFTSIQTSSHQVCSSDFVSDRWIKTIYSGSNVTYFYADDFQTDGSAIFQALASLCRLTKNHVLQSMDSFYQQTLISPTVLSETVFQAEVSASIKQIQLTASTEFASQLQLLQMLILVNQFVSGLQTNINLLYDSYFSGGWYATTSPIESPEPDGSWCACLNRIDCYLSSEITNVFGLSSPIDVPDNFLVLMTIPGMVHSCLPVNGILRSTLECFYDQTCLETLLSFFPSNENFVAMSLSQKSRFKINSTVQDMIDQLMIEEWNTQTSYEDYYRKCAPISCSYIMNETDDWSYVLKKLIGLLSGLVLVLGLVLKQIVRFVRRRRNARVAESAIPLFQRLKTTLSKTLLSLNIFQRYRSNRQQIRYQQIATRFYILFLVASMIILSFYTFIVEDIHRKTLHYPSELQYQQLESSYSDNLLCSCSNISMPYSTFVSINTSFHQVCSSDLISQRWIEYNAGGMNDAYVIYFTFDYRVIATSQFQLLVILCQQAEKLIKESLELFYQTQLFSTYIIPQNLMESRANLLINDWYSRTLSRFLRMIKLFRAISHGNLLSNGLLNVVASSRNRTDRNIKMEARSYSKCSCALSASCVANMSIYEANQTIRDTAHEVLTVSNFFVGCFPMEALLKSTLQCYYNLSCMLEIDKYLPGSLGSSFNFSPLNETLTSPHETVESIVSKLMIHSWSSSVSFSSYYRACKPESCSYEYMGRSNIFYVITTIIGIYGGLSFGLKLISFIILRCVETFINFHSFHELRRIINNIFMMSNEHQMTHRLQFLFLFITLYLIFMFSIYTPQSVTVHIDQPSLSIYEQLSREHPETLQCSCTKISIPYGSFLTVQPVFHHLCASNFVSEQWIYYAYLRDKRMSPGLSSDYQSSSTGQFLLLSSLCQLSKEAINDTIHELLISGFTSSRFLSVEQLNQQIQATIIKFQRTTPKLFLNIVNMIRELTGSNMLISGWSTNWRFITETVIRHEWAAHTAAITYGGCDCGSSWMCTQPSGGMMVGCYALEALLQSTLHCFYDQSCIDVDQNFMKLNESLLKNSRFNLNTSIQMILDYLMVEDYQFNLSYPEYVRECALSSCTYSYVKIHDVTETTVSLISLYGGLFILTHCLATIISKVYYRRTNRVHPQTIEQTT